MDWTFWVGGAVIVVLVIVTQVFLHESRWSQRWRPEEPDDADGTDRTDPPGDADGPGGRS
ncbi:hypothetical protein [Agromyces sp. C10]|uniref:hypothetical protein n=1 Tax=Agromyces sp. C10 TaxID=2935077 RepID=UPI00200A466A|nr:hypothetical protein [Agromyces sp. C10]MCK8609715.1 hypothetical protein [Agromyces sp. C10]